MDAAGDNGKRCFLRPDPEKCTNMSRFRDRVNEKYGLSLCEYSFYLLNSQQNMCCSVTQSTHLWRSMWMCIGRGGVELATNILCRVWPMSVWTIWKLWYYSTVNYLAVIFRCTTLSTVRYMSGSGIMILWSLLQRPTLVPSLELLEVWQLSGLWLAFDGG